MPLFRRHWRIESIRGAHPFVELLKPGYNSGGVVANLIVVEQARREGIEIRFVGYLKVGLPVTIITLVIDIAWLQFFG